MYGDKYVNGEYKIDGDTLKFISLDFKENKWEISKHDKLIVEKNLSTFLVHDSLLIPTKHFESLTMSRIMKRDSTIIKAFAQRDGHVHYMFSFYSDSTFTFKTGSDTDRNSTKGIWHEDNNIIYLNPTNSDNYLYWICSNNRMRIYKNYLIGATINEEKKTIEYQYLLGFEPTD